MWEICVWEEEEDWEEVEMQYLGIRLVMFCCPFFFLCTCIYVNSNMPVLLLCSLLVMSFFPLLRILY
jgi:hypothetical protein